MAGGEHEAQQVVTDPVVHGVVDGGAAVGRLHHLDVPAEHLDLAPVGALATVVVDGPALRGGHEPRGRVRGDPGRRPVLEGSEQCVLRDLLGQPEVAGDPGEAGHETGGLDAPHGLDGPTSRSRGPGDRHDGPSKQVRPAGRSPPARRP